MTGDKTSALSISALPLQPASAIIVNDKRLLPGEDLPGMRKRLARSLARPEDKPHEWIEQFEWMLQFAFPAGRISANLGAEHLKPNVSTINCTVSQTIGDSMKEIMDAATAAALTLKAGCGIGYDFSTIRPRGARVSGANAYTSGVLPFMDIFDSTCKTVRSSGDRRGAQMGCLDICHPDVLDFIKAKREDGRFRAFNLSILGSYDLMKAIDDDADWPFVFPAFKEELDGEIIYKWWPLKDEKYTYNNKGQTACKVYRKMPARELWNTIMRSTYEFSDPGFIVIDRYNYTNPLWWVENIRATNP